MRNDFIDVQLECDDKFIRGFEFGNQYDWFFSERHDKIDGEAINDELRYVNL